MARQDDYKDFSIRIQRGDRIGIVGPNGCGKSTLLKLILGQLDPQGGRVRLGTKLELLYFDQLRGQQVLMRRSLKISQTVTIRSLWVVSRVTLLVISRTFCFRHYVLGHLCVCSPVVNATACY